MENDNLQWIFPLQMVIFHCNVKLPEGNRITRNRRTPRKRVVRLSDGSLDEHLVDAAGQPSQPSVRPAPKDGDHTLLSQEGGNVYGI